MRPDLVGLAHLGLWVVLTAWLGHILAPGANVDGFWLARMGDSRFPLGRRFRSAALWATH
jgi:hypothetical protein